jgi:uncharacterized damage-inducible protein DinB
MKLAYAKSMARYNAWMNERLYELCARLPDEERKRDAGAFFKSIHGTLNHLLLGDRLWLGRFTGKPYDVGSLSQELCSDFEVLRQERKMTDAAIEAWAAGLQEEELLRELRWSSVVNPMPRRSPLWFAIVHFFNHQTHHRGQVTTLLTQRGVDPGVTDLIWLPDGPVKS